MHADRLAECSLFFGVGNGWTVGQDGQLMTWRKGKKILTRGLVKRAWAHLIHCLPLNCWPSSYSQPMNALGVTQVYRESRLGLRSDDFNHSDPLGTIYKSYELLYSPIGCQVIDTICWMKCGSVSGVSSIKFYGGRNVRVICVRARLGQPYISRLP